MRRKTYGTIVLKRDKGERLNTTKGKANKAKTLARMGLTEEIYTKPKFIIINGIPYKYDKKGNRIPLTRKI